MEATAGECASCSGQLKRGETRDLLIAISRQTSPARFLATCRRGKASWEVPLEAEMPPNVTEQIW